MISPPIDLPEALRFGKVIVSCEGWTNSGDPYILKGEVFGHRTNEFLIDHGQVLAVWNTDWFRCHTYRKGLAKSRNLRCFQVRNRPTSSLDKRSFDLPRLGLFRHILQSSLVMYSSVDLMAVGWALVPLILQYHPR
jgi:hypothetical protein